MKATEIELGLDTFGDLAKDDAGEVMSYGAALRQVVKEAVIADKSGVDVITLGEHHRDEYAISSPETVLAAIATQTERIRLGSGVTVLSSDDPVRVFERFATVDGLSNGRAEVILGRGSFTESFPLFGFDLEDYDDLFEEKIAMFAKILEEKPMDWEGEYTQKLTNTEIFPKTESGHLKTMVGVGGSPESIIRAARYDFPVVLAIIGGDPARFQPYVELYKRAAERLGNPVHPIAMHSHGFIADTQEEAEEMAWENIKLSFDKIGKTRGWAPMTREHFNREMATGSMYVGTPEVVAQRMAKAIQTLNVGRFDLVYGAGEQPAAARERMIELYGTQVIPRVRELLVEAGYAE
ncbi:Limonene 1,2-monooxygenase [Weissella ceti]|uniref:Limonene 1,2-monooxygenase n=2 Tax=Weissella TaxID=46255 RepID=A0A075TZ43_9LACO|nr:MULTISPECIES: LLM class flavin-dependent oxidoreductase [Weissella]AIG65188.1 Limonene 1,2-monooxygenase [Weissella tructae]AIM62501.1 Limonene 1,2-monooxygenase [Weissella ceti]AIM63837.1 Limonene 1,2-monooxygenase [Weissella ceti]